MSRIPSSSVCRGPNIVGGFRLSPDCFVFSCPNQWVVLTLMWHINQKQPKKERQALKPIWLVSCWTWGFGLLIFYLISMSRDTHRLKNPFLRATQPASLLRMVYGKTMCAPCGRSGQFYKQEVKPYRLQVQLSSLSEQTGPGAAALIANSRSVLS